jgi:hypothetical protein
MRSDETNHCTSAKYAGRENLAAMEQGRNADFAPNSTQNVFTESQESSSTQATS